MSALDLAPIKGGLLVKRTCSSRLLSRNFEQAGREIVYNGNPDIKSALSRRERSRLKPD
jgi:hypothetical protein